MPGPADIAVVDGANLVALTHDEQLVDDWLRSKSAKTRKAYGSDVAHFARWAGADPAAAVASMLDAGHLGARSVALRYREAMLEAGLAPSTINRRLAALRSVVELARDVGLVPWRLDVRGLKSRAYRNTAGPGLAGVKRILATAKKRKGARGRRDAAIVRVLWDLGLRRAEVCSLNVGHVDFAGKKLWILGKGRGEREPLSLPRKTSLALRAHLKLAPDTDPSSPLFRNNDPSKKGGPRMSSSGLYKLIVELAETAGVGHVTPHAIRHAAITYRLDACGGDYRSVRAFSRHAKIETVQIYDDNREDGFLTVATAGADAI